MCARQAGLEALAVMPSPLPDEAEESFDPDESIRRYKRKRLLDLRYAEPDADELAALDVDIHQLEALIERGCPPATAARIVRP